LLKQFNLVANNVQAKLFFYSHCEFQLVPIPNGNKPVKRQRFSFD